MSLPYFFFAGAAFFLAAGFLAAGFLAAGFSWWLTGRLLIGDEVDGRILRRGRAWRATVAADIRGPSLPSLATDPIDPYATAVSSS